MDTNLIIKMSEGYFNKVVPNPEDYKTYPHELIEFWEFAESVLWIPTDVYELRKFIGAEKGGPGLDIPAMLVSFTAGALAASIKSLFECIIKYLSRNERREITIKKGDTRLILKGRSLPEEKEFIRMLFPELLTDRHDDEDEDEL